MSTQTQQRVLKELEGLKPRQVKRVLEFIHELKESPTEDTLLGMLGQLDAKPERIERVCRQLGQRGTVTPRLLQKLEAIAQAKMTASKQRRVHRLLRKNQEGTIAFEEKIELDRLVTEAEILTLQKAQAMTALKYLRETVTGNGRKGNGL